jgi:methionine-S-sulfoxide reductase
LKKVFLPLDEERRKEGMVMLKTTFLTLGMILMIATNATGDSTKGTASGQKLERATFAGGCFWCMEPPFDKLDGVISTISGYTGGTEKNPTYEQVSSGKTGHLEAIEVTYDPSRVSYSQLLDVFWKNIDPTQNNGQFVDVGAQYRTAIFYHTEEQRRLALESRNRLQESRKFGKPIVTEIRPAMEFYSAEDYHQDYYMKNPIRYKYYRWGSGRDGFLEETWGKKD